MKEAEKRHLRYTARRRNRQITDQARQGRLRGRRTHAFWKRRALAVVVAAYGLLALVVAVDYLVTGPAEIRRGVEIGGLKLGGMTRDEAGEAITRHASAYGFVLI